MYGPIHFVRGTCFDEIFFFVLKELSNKPQYVCKPRGQLIHENIAMSFVLDDPRARLLNNKNRETNYGFGVGEFLWYWRGEKDLKTMLYYNKRMKDFSDDGVTLNSCYGSRMKKDNFFVDGWVHGTGMSQWDVVKKTLAQDPDSRRAIILINRPEDEVAAVTRGSKDVPCTLSMQFFIRENKLDMHVHMRSNDAVWGLTYDLFSFTLFQECMLLELKRDCGFESLQLGKYYHTAGSLHLYERHFELANKMIVEYASMRDMSFSPMEPIGDIDKLEELACDERSLRECKCDLIDTMKFEGHPSLVWMAEQLNAHRKKRDAENRIQK